MLILLIKIHINILGEKMSNMINALNMQYNTQPKSSSQNNDKDRLKKIIEKHYQNDYEEDMKKHKTGFAMLCVTAVVGLTGFFFCKQERGLTGLMGFGSLLGLLFTPVLKRGGINENFF